MPRASRRARSSGAVSATASRSRPAASTAPRRRLPDRAHLALAHREPRAHAAPALARRVRLPAPGRRAVGAAAGARRWPSPRSRSPPGRPRPISPTCAATAPGGACRLGERVGDVWIIVVVALGTTLRVAQRALGRARARAPAGEVGGVGHRRGHAAVRVSSTCCRTRSARRRSSRSTWPASARSRCPAAFAIAVVRHQFMDIDVIIRRSLIYASVAATAHGRLSRDRAVPRRAPRAARRAVGRGRPHRRAPRSRSRCSCRPGARSARWIDQTFFRLRTGHERAAARVSRVDPRGGRSRRMVARARRFRAQRRSASARSRSCAWAIRTAARLLVPAASMGRREPVERALAALATAPPETMAAPGSTGAARARAGRVSIPRSPPAGLVLVRPLAGPDGPLGVLALGREGDRAAVRRTGSRCSSARSRPRPRRRSSACCSCAAPPRRSRRLKRQEELDRKKSEFLSQVAHDLGTPLTSILWSSQNLIDGVLGTARSARHGGRALRRRRGLAPRAGWCRTWSRSRASRRRARDRVRNPSGLARRARPRRPRAIAPIAARKGVRIELDAWPPDIPCARCDREGLMKVALNLLDNAIKYAPRGLRDRGAPDGGPRPASQAFAVEDRGPGVPDAQKRAIFERYARGDGPPQGGRPGFGLGLFVARTVVEACGGTLDVRDVPGGGAAFVCTLHDFGSPGRQRIDGPAPDRRR